MATREIFAAPPPQRKKNTKETNKQNRYFYIIALPQPAFSSIVCRVLAYTLEHCLIGRSLCAGGGGADMEFSSNQVPPKKEIPTEPTPKRWAAGWGL